MGLIQVDFLSVTIGYIAGVMLMWSLCQTFYGENDEQETEAGDKHLYSGSRYGWSDMFVSASNGEEP